MNKFNLILQTTSLVRPFSRRQPNRLSRVIRSSWTLRLDPNVLADTPTVLPMISLVNDWTGPLGTPQLSVCQVWTHQVLRTLVAWNIRRVVARVRGTGDRRRWLVHLRTGRLVWGSALMCGGRRRRRDGRPTVNGGDEGGWRWRWHGRHWGPALVWGTGRGVEMLLLDLIRRIVG